MNQAQIRPYTIEDRLPLLEVFWQNVPTFFDPSEIADLEAYLDQKPLTYFVLVDQELRLGGAGLRLSNEGKTGHITWIFFHPACQGKGFGSKLLHHCLARLAEYEEVTRIELTTSQLAYQFFEKFGFEVVETQKDFWGKGLDLYRMVKEKQG
ncbi:MAG: N-acetyltransferase [Bacteroidota bacterium]